MSVQGYADYLIQKNKQMKLVHANATPVGTVSDNMSVKFLKTSPITKAPYTELSMALSQIAPYQFLPVDDYAPLDKQRQYEFFNLIDYSMKEKCALLTYSPDNNVGSIHFMWKVEEDNESDMVTRMQVPIEEAKKQLPVLHTRMMRRALYDMFGKISNHVKPYEYRFLYQQLSGDHSQSCNLFEKEIDKRVTQIIEMEDPDIIPDLHVHNSGRKERLSMTFRVLWMKF